MLWNSGVLPYAQRAWITLEEKNIEFEYKIIDLSNKPQEFLDKYEIAWGGRGASAKVPLLEYGDTLVVESSDVAKFTAQNIGNNTDMYPFEDAEFIDQFIDAFDLTIQDYYSFLTAMSDTEVEAAKDPLRESLNTLEEFFSSDDGPFVLGDKFSVAESFAAPWVHRFFDCFTSFSKYHCQRNCVVSKSPTVVGYSIGTSIGTRYQWSYQLCLVIHARIFCEIFDTRITFYKLGADPESPLAFPRQQNQAYDKH